MPSCAAGIEIESESESESELVSLLCFPVLSGLWGCYDRGRALDMACACHSAVNSSDFIYILAKGRNRNSRKQESKDTVDGRGLALPRQCFEFDVGQSQDRSVFTC